jgi:glycogen synthase
MPTPLTAEAPRERTLRVAMPAWEIGRAASGLGVKIGGLAVVVEELPPALVAAAAKQGVKLEVETLTPCFAHYDRSRLTPIDERFPVTIAGHTFDFSAYTHTFPDGQRVVYFWDEWQLGWTRKDAIYPSDPQMALVLYAAVCQAMALYVKRGRFDVVHLHDYHVGLVPFYLGDEFLSRVPAHLTIHNASYQGIAPIVGSGYSALDRIGLRGELLFHRYFEFFGRLNLMRAAMLRVFESGGRITTVSGDLDSTWGYAAELRESEASLWGRAFRQKGEPPVEVFLPNRHLDLFERLPIAGITNGMGAANRPESLPHLSAAHLTALQERRGETSPIFRHPTTQAEMLARDHHYTADTLDTKIELKRLLHLEIFGTEPEWNPILLTAVGRLVEQKNFGLIADVAPRIIAYDPGVKFVILASAPDDDPGGRALERAFFGLARRYPAHVFFSNQFNEPLSRLILAGGDFTLIPSRFEPCGLVDFEASLLGTVVIGRATGGLTKVRRCAYLYEWLDVGDRAGEGHAFFWQIKTAIDTFRHAPERHAALVRAAMAIDASWDRSAAQYVEMYLASLP